MNQETVLTMKNVPDDGALGDFLSLASKEVIAHNGIGIMQVPFYRVECALHGFVTPWEDDHDAVKQMQELHAKYGHSGVERIVRRFVWYEKDSDYPHGSFYCVKGDGVEVRSHHYRSVSGSAWPLNPGARLNVGGSLTHNFVRDLFFYGVKVIDVPNIALLEAK